MSFITASSIISAQNSFRNRQFWADRKPVDASTGLILPDFKDFIPAASLRRLSPVLRFAIATAIDCKEQVGKDFDAIAVGTALGCLVDTEKFLTTIHTVSGETLPPTSFIQSTHNTIGGQISLVLGNHAYNMTHTQNGLSFEVALLDALLAVQEGQECVLVGAADEHIPFLDELQWLTGTQRPLVGGSAFFTLEPKGTIRISQVETITEIGDGAEMEILNFLQAHSGIPAEFALILHNGISSVSGLANAVNYEEYFGYNLTGSAMAMAAGVSYLNDVESGRVLILNHSCNTDLGIIALEK